MSFELLTISFNRKITVLKFILQKNQLFQQFLKTTKKEDF